jgi:hypothetical protein
MVENQLPMLVKFKDNPAEDLAHGFAMEDVLVPLYPEAMTYFSLLTAGDLLHGTTVAQGGVDMNLSNLCPIPIAWAPYFLDFKAPYEALQMGKALLATLETVAQWMRAMPLLGWLRATCVWLGPNAMDRTTRSMLDQGFEPTALDVRVVTWMQSKLALYQKASRVSLGVPGTGIVAVNPLLPESGLAAHAAEKEYSALETSKNKAAFGLMDVQWDTGLAQAVSTDA